MCPFLLFFTPFLSVQESNRHLSHKTMRLTANPKTSIRRKDYSIQKLEKDRNLAESLHKQELLSPFGFLYLTKISYSIWIQIFLSARMQYDFKLKFKSIKRHWPEPWWLNGLHTYFMFSSCRAFRCQWNECCTAHGHYGHLLPDIFSEKHCSGSATDGCSLCRDLQRLSTHH